MRNSAPKIDSNQAAASQYPRVLFVIDSLNSGGAQRQLVTSAVGLKRLGYQVDVFTYHPDSFFADELDQENIPVILASKKSRFSITPILALRRLFASNTYDIAIAFLKTPSIYAIIAKSFARSKTKLVVSDRSAHGRIDAGRFDNQKERFLTRANHLLVNSFHLAEHYRSAFPKFADKVSTIWNGIDTQEFQFAELPVQALPLKILCVGNVSPIKNWECLVEAARQLKTEDSFDFQISHAGRIHDLSDANQAYYKQLNSLIENAGLTDHWKWLGKQSDIREQYVSHDVIVHPSRVEGLPNVICEAMAVGRPVFASEVLDHPRLIKHRERGYLFPPDNPQRLAQLLREYEGLPEADRNRMSASAHSFASRELSVANMLDSLTELVRRVTSGDSVGRVN